MAARAALADWLAEHGDDEGANWAADTDYPVGMSHWAVGPGSPEQLPKGTPQGIYRTALAAGAHRWHPDAVASAHNSWRAFADLMGDIHEGGAIFPAHREVRDYYAPAAFLRARNRRGPAFIQAGPLPRRPEVFHPDTARRLNALSRRFGPHAVSPVQIGDRVELVHTGGYHTPMPEDPDPDYEESHGYAHDADPAAYRYPTDDYGNITGIMSPISRGGFMHGRWGPKPKVRGVGYAVDDASTTYANQLQSIHYRLAVLAGPTHYDDAQTFGGHEFYVGDDGMIHSFEEGANYASPYAPTSYADADDQYEPPEGDGWTRPPMPSEMPPAPPQAPAEPQPLHIGGEHLMPDPDEPWRKALDATIPASLTLSGNHYGVMQIAHRNGQRVWSGGFPYEARRAFEAATAARQAWDEGDFDTARYKHKEAADAHQRLIDPAVARPEYAEDAEPFDDEHKWHPDHQDASGKAFRGHLDAMMANRYASFHAPEGGPVAQFGNLVAEYLRTGDLTPLHAAADFLAENGHPLGEAMIQSLNRGRILRALNEAGYAMSMSAEWPTGPEAAEEPPA